MFNLRGAVLVGIFAFTAGCGSIPGIPGSGILLDKAKQTAGKAVVRKLLMSASEAEKIPGLSTKLNEDQANCLAGEILDRASPAQLKAIVSNPNLSSLSSLFDVVTSEASMCMENH